jgi:hypothetical protein
MRLKKPLLLAFAATFVSIAVLPVAAQTPAAALRGVYGFTGTTTCVISPSGFNTDLTPVSDTGVVMKTYVSQGTFTFHPNGTGIEQFQDVVITQPGDSLAAAGGASDAGSSPITYTMAAGGAFTLNFQSTSLTELTGPSAGATVTVLNKPSQIGQIARNGNIAITSNSPAVEELVSAAGATLQIRICVRSHVLFPL